MGVPARFGSARKFAGLDDHLLRAMILRHRDLRQRQRPRGRQRRAHAGQRRQGKQDLRPRHGFRQDRWGPSAIARAAAF